MPAIPSTPHLQANGTTALRDPALSGSAADSSQKASRLPLSGGP